MARQRQAKTEMGLLDAIHAEPRSDELRLIYADWLDDNGQGEYAEFIRLQVARAAAVRVCAYIGGEGIIPREQALAEAHAASWARPICRETRCWQFLRGIPLVKLMATAF